MVERTLSDEIIIIIEDYINKLPINLDGIITKIYPNDFVDISTSNGIIRYVECVGAPILNAKGVVVFVNNDFNNPFFISESKGGGDLSNYVRKNDLLDKTKYDIDLNLSFGLKGQDDTIVINMDIVDHVVNKEINLRGD